MILQKTQSFIPDRIDDMRINIYTDGGCSGNPGPGGWAFVMFAEGPEGTSLGPGAMGNSGSLRESESVLFPEGEADAQPPRDRPASPAAGVEKNGGELATTNNRMELTAVIRALETVPMLDVVIDEITVFTDSQYVQKGISEWIAGWKKKGWITSSKRPVKNADLWKKLDALAAGYPIRWKWVKGHAGDPLNERCDALVQRAIQAVRAGGGPNGGRTPNGGRPSNGVRPSNGGLA
jgi:ribonuclease HI